MLHGKTRCFLRLNSEISSQTYGSVASGKEFDKYAIAMGLSRNRISRLLHRELLRR